MDEIGTRKGDAVFADAPFTESMGGAVSWGAIFAGGVGAAALSLILLTLGSGLGLASISPWLPARESAARFGFAAIVWVCVTQVLASGLGGYLAGRLRRRWVALHVDETYFRDTAHGFLSWSVATLATAALLTSTVSGLLHSGAQVATAGLTGAAGSLTAQRGNATEAGNVWPMGYLVDGLFRQPSASAPTGNTPQSDKPPTDEVVRVLLNGLNGGQPLSAEDTRYLGQLVAQRTGLSQDAATARVTMVYGQLQQRVADVEASARAAAEKARQVAIYASLWIFISLLMGAFSASLFAIFGGRQRDL